VHPRGELHSEVVSLVEELALLNDATVVLAEPAAAEREDRLDELALGLRADGIDARTLLLEGKPWMAVVQEVLREEHDIVVVQTEAKGRGFDIETLNLLRKCPCPVWVVRPSQGLRPRRVLAAVDATAEDHDHGALNHQILAFAATVTEQMGAELHLVHAWPESEREEADWRAEYGRTLTELLRPHHIDRGRTRLHLVEGDPAKVIADVAREQEIDLVIMGTVCRTGVAGFLIGNTAETTLSEVSCAVLAVKPEGFVTPVVPSPRVGVDERSRPVEER